MGLWVALGISALKDLSIAPCAGRKLTALGTEEYQ